MLRQQLRERRRERGEWRALHSQNTTRSQNAARAGTVPERELVSASSLLRRLGNADPGTIVPAPEERADDRARGPPEAPTRGPETGEGGLRFQAPLTKDWLDDKEGIYSLGPRIRGSRKWE